jgi:hypothetical protein
MKRSWRPPLSHPLADLFDLAVDSLCTALGSASQVQYRGTVRNFLSYLGPDHPEVNSLD